MKLAYIVLCLVAVSTAENIVELATKLGANELVKLVTEAGLGNTLATGGKF